MALYEALEVRAVRGTDPAIEALDYVRQVTARRSRLAGESVEAPVGHVTDRWRRLVFEGRKDINGSMYEVAAFEALNDGLRSGDLYALGSRRYQTFESYLLTKEHWSQLKETPSILPTLGRWTIVDRFGLAYPTTSLLLDSLSGLPRISSVDAVRARLYVLSAEQGGRRSPIATGYRAGCWIDPIDPSIGGNDGIVTVEDGTLIAPGEEGIAHIYFLFPELVQDKPKPGTTFEIREGFRLVARATVISTT